jgi:signal transduction histidine kinase
MRANASAAGLTIEMELTPDTLYVEGDMFALSRVCRNLVMNAIEATAPNGRITIGTASEHGRAVLRVADTGCGIPADRLETMFEDFNTTKRQGLGLGLAITKKIVDQLAGTITATSVVGTGTTFAVSLARVPAPAEGIRDGPADGSTGEPAPV